MASSSGVSGPAAVPLDVSRLLDAMGARPRPAGSPAEASARAHARGMLEQGGFSVHEAPFEYSAFPGRWATSLSGLAAIVVLGASGHFAALGSPWIALMVLVSGSGLIGGVASWLARRGVLDAPLMRRSGVTLVATRGVPTVWVMAHLDTKSQPVPILVRAAAITASVLIFIAAGALAVAQGLGFAGTQLWPALTVAGVVALLPVAASMVGTRSDGAIDNASGCAAVLLAARALPLERALGVILTSAEELGLAGARAFARDRAPATCINCDGVDDEGNWMAMYTGTAPQNLLAAVARSTLRLSMRVRPRRLLPGILVDGVALADAGWQVVTISHGSMATLGRIHTARDSRRSLRGSAIAPAATLITTIIGEVR